MIGARGENLILLISQPRAGSTLLQRLLASQQDVHTTAEPWLMLPPIYAQRERGTEAEYDAVVARAGHRGFLRTLPEGDEAYVEGMRRMYSYLYSRATESAGKRWFLDKTPRYYLIVPELLRTFPEAKFVVLVRNPLAVLTSIVRTWMKRDWLGLREYAIDIERGPGLVAEAMNSVGERGTVVRYESLVSSPEREMRRLCEFIGIDFTPASLQYDKMERWGLGDQNVYLHDRPIGENVDKWHRDTSDPQMWRAVREYLSMIGPETMSALGYDFDALAALLDTHRPTRGIIPTFSLRWCLEPETTQPRWYRYGFLRMTGLLRRRGLRGSLGESSRRLRQWLRRGHDDATSR